MTFLPIVERWLRTRNFDASSFPAERISVERDATVSLCLLAGKRTELEPAVATLERLIEQGVADELVVLGVDPDGSAAHDARMVPAATLVSELGSLLGRGDGLWRSLSVMTGDVVAFLDGDLDGFGERVACGLIGPLVCEPGVRLAAGFGTPFENGGVTELTVRPLLRRFWPELAGLREPLPRELAASRVLLDSVPFSVGSEVGLGLLLDAHASVGLRNLAQVDLGPHRADGSARVEPAMAADAVIGMATRRLSNRCLVRNPSIQEPIERSAIAAGRTPGPP